METSIEKIINTYAAITLTAAFCISLYTFVPWSTLTPSDYGTWVGSIGTVGAFVGTIWLATTESRRKRDGDLLLARLHGANILFQLCHAQQVAIDVRNIMENANEEDHAWERIQQCRRTLDTIETWKAPDLIPLAPLPGHVALKMAEWNDQLVLVKKRLDEAITAANTTYYFNNAQWLLLAHSLGQIMHSIVLKLRDVIKVLRHASNDLAASTE